MHVRESAKQDKYKVNTVKLAVAESCVGGKKY